MVIRILLRKPQMDKKNHIDLYSPFDRINPLSRSNLLKAEYWAQPVLKKCEYVILPFSHQEAWIANIYKGNSVSAGTCWSHASALYAI
jgi:hypothetical protein